MPNISLRAYLQRIESWIEENKIDKAISQSLYLLQQFPKNLNAFQVLSKALLQKQDFSKAENVFDIILQIEPDDFVSHIGKSIIAEYNHLPDSAIEHMKYAFETQPANEGLQNELKRLLFASDGVEPKKIHLTRGALIKMYYKGKLYQQAISEAKIGISENPQRIDYKIAMAKSFFESGDLIQAVETCVEIISQLPYCLPANQILDQVLSKNHTINNNGFYHNRLIAIDPYYAFMLESTKSVFDVPDIAVMVEDNSANESINYNFESIISAAEINKVELDSAENVPASFAEWDSIINSGIESSEEKSGSNENNNVQDKNGLINHTQSDKMADSRKKNFLNKLRISKSQSDDVKNVPDWFFDENGEINHNELEPDYLESENPAEEVSLESGVETQESNLSESGVFDADIVPAINDMDDLEMSNTLWINDEEDHMHEPNQKPVIALEDTQQIMIIKETSSDLLTNSAKALEGGNTKFAFATLSKLISENQNLPVVVNQLERALELYPNHSEFRLLLSETYLAMGEKEKSLEILQKAQKNISL